MDQTTILAVLEKAAAKELGRKVEKSDPGAGERDINHTVRLQLRGRAKQGEAVEAKAPGPKVALADVLALLMPLVSPRFSLKRLEGLLRRSLTGEGSDGEAFLELRDRYQAAIDKIQAEASAAEDLPRVKRKGAFSFSGLCDVVAVEELPIADTEFKPAAPAMGQADALCSKVAG